MNIEKNERLTQLYEFYGILLTKTQQKYFNDYYFDDFSLAEIAENAAVSRAAVYDNLRRTSKILADYEAKLHLADNFSIIEQNLEKAISANQENDQEAVKLNLEQIKKIIEEN